MSGGCRPRGSAPRSSSISSEADQRTQPGPSTRHPVGLPSLAGRCPAPESASILIKANALDVEEGDIHRPARSPDLGEIDPHFGQYSGV